MTDTNSRSRVTRTDESNSSQGFNGTVDRNEENRTSRNGNFDTSARGEAQVDVSARENTKGDFPSFMIVSGSTGGTTDLSTSGTLDADHERVRQEGQAKAKETGDEDFTTRTGSSGKISLSDGGLTWTKRSEKYETDGDSSSDASRDFEEDSGDDEDTGESASGGLTDWRRRRRHRRRFRLRRQRQGDPPGQGHDRHPQVHRAGKRLQEVASQRGLDRPVTIPLPLR